MPEMKKIQIYVFLCVNGEIKISFSLAVKHNNTDIMCGGYGAVIEKASHFYRRDQN